MHAGVHPEVQKAQERARKDSVPSLPIHDPNRDHVLLEIAVGGRVLGRLVIELFNDLLPAGSNHLRNRRATGPACHSARARARSQR
jgi:hypothetical protein